MEKYGYKNISNRNEFVEHTEKMGKYQFSNNSGKYITHYDLINWCNQSHWGIPGQTKNNIKSLEDLLKANEIVSGNTKLGL